MVKEASGVVKKNLCCLAGSKGAWLSDLMATSGCRMAALSMSVGKLIIPSVAEGEAQIDM
jgi:hypothetical protein